MMVFPKEAKYEYCKNRLVEECKNKLETTLRVLGNFIPDKSVNITNYVRCFQDNIYMLRDLDNTIFIFYNFGLGYPNSSDKRFKKNYQILMQRNNSKYTYKYDFYEYEYDKYQEKLRMIEISYFIAENKNIKLERKINEPIRIIIEDKYKEYLLVFNCNNQEEDIKILEDFENIVMRATKIEKFSIGNILTILKNQQQLDFIAIFKEKQLLSCINMHDNNTCRYIINNSSQNANINIVDYVNREEIRKITEENIKLKTKKLLIKNQL